MGAGREPVAPRRPASFFCSLTGLDLRGDAARGEAEAVIALVARGARDAPVWTVDGIGELRVTGVSHDPVAGARIGLEVAGVGGELSLVMGADGWIRAEVSFGGARVLAFAERVYEEIELWPPGAEAPLAAEAPGRMGKRARWLSLSAKAWPEIAGLASAGWLTLEAVPR